VIIEIDKSITEALNDTKIKDSLKNDIESSLDIIAMMRRQKTHTIFAKEDVCKNLIQFSKNHQVRCVFDEIYRKYSIIGSIWKKMKYTLRLSISSTDLTCFEHENKNVISISPAYFKEMRTSEIVFLTEGDKDKHLYDAIISYHVDRLAITSEVSCKYEDILGGGNTTAPQYKVFQDGKTRLCLCIADSDKKTPYHRPEETAVKVNNVDDPKQPLCKFHMLEVHEVENLLSKKMLMKVCGTDPGLNSALAFFNKIDSEYKLFFDMKKGFKAKQFTTDDLFWTYWNKYFPQFSKKKCPYEPCSSKHGCQVQRGFGKHILNQVQDVFLKSVTPKQIEEALCDQLKLIWNALGELIVSWSCAPRHSLRV
jgi:hypothetical protein